MKFIIVLFAFLVTCSTGIAQKKASKLTMDELLVLLPDSVFSYSNRLSISTSFTKEERKKIFNQPDSSIYKVEEQNDSIHFLHLYNLGDYHLKLQYWVKDKNTIIVGLIEASCDFVMCHQQISFFIYDGKKWKDYPFYFENTPLLHFFKKDALTACGFQPDEGSEAYSLTFQKGEINVYFQIENVEEELMGEEGKYVCLTGTDALTPDQEVNYWWTGKKFKLKVLPAGK